jgi:diguanylate cyclase (GGDEF)-like protein
MATPLERASRMDLFLDATNNEGVGAEKYETKIARIERMGVRLFSVANCLVSFGGLAARFDRNEQSILMQEALFCDALGFSEEIKVYSDLSRDEALAKHPYVENQPFIRFCAQHPILDANHMNIGCVYLIDYAAREFDDESRLLFADLAIMAEREVLLGTMSLQQLEMQKQIRGLKRLALLDPVLGMWNRTAIMRSLGIELDRCYKAEKPVSLLYISSDQYRTLKERFGSTTGDSFLLKLASRMRSCIRPFDALGRFESDAFLIVLPGASNLVAAAVAERIRLSVISHPEMIENQVFDISVCIGMASTSVFPIVTPEIFMKYAEKALIEAQQPESSTHIVHAQPGSVDIVL